MIKPVELGLWKYGKTEDLHTGRQFYDYSSSGRLLESKATCPFCLDGELVVWAGGDGCGNISAQEWYCGACNETGNILGGFGDRGIEFTEDGPDENLILPSLVVIEVE